MNILLYGEMISKSVSLLAKKITIPCQFLTYAESVSDISSLLKALNEADVLVSMTFRSQWPTPIKLKLLQVPGVGVDGIDFKAIPSYVPVCLSYGHGASVSEYIINGLLTFLHKLREIEGDFRQGRWDYSSRVCGPFHDQLAGKNIGLIGYGTIGKALVQRLVALECFIHVANRNDILPNHKFVKYWPLSSLTEMVSRLDALVVCIAHTPETDQIVNEELLANLKSNCFLINVSRGACIAEEALFNALKTKVIAGAMLDTWWNYPSLDSPNPPPGHCDWVSLPNVIMTPHTSAWTEHMWDIRLNEVASNIHAIATGQELKNLFKR